MDDVALRIRLNLVVLFLVVCASFLGAITVGVMGFAGLGVAAILFAVFFALGLYFVQQWQWEPEMEDVENGSEIE